MLHAYLHHHRNVKVQQNLDSRQIDGLKAVTICKLSDGIIRKLEQQDKTNHDKRAKTARHYEVLFHIGALEL